MRWAVAALAADLKTEVFYIGYAQPTECVHGCLPWDEIPDSILKPYGFETSGQLFSDGEAPAKRWEGDSFCALPSKLAFQRETPWCYCPGPVAGWAYCTRVPANCSHEIEAALEAQAETFQAAACMHRDNLCGHWVRPCRAAARGGNIYYEDDEQYHPDGSFERLSRLAPSLQSCRDGNFFLHMRAKGSWRHEKASAFLNGTSLIMTEIQEAWLQIQREMVRESIDRGGKEDKVLWFNTSQLLQEFCPCNGWPWRVGKEFVERHIVLFCRPASQCPLLHEVVVRRPQFFHYNASPRDVCFFEPGTSRLTGWGFGLPEFSPVIEGCVLKRVPRTCDRIIGHATSAAWWVAVATLFL